ncbi:sigma-70 family RNA polymerase sigma factor [Candidatus Chloroploca sp. Khr17]|uniref:sigma-70 family RNA polymerase sigma factor n=1 Tax=Candidatus Chloroploca sp. Khr17 TaxID=2496869 RepID=UPI001F0D4A78|nr:sigma-70 family RNA polymerase sigma factor [Candidatus Chloroploca sp. Khr17]
MPTVIRAPITTLDALERQFHSQIQTVSLIGELPLTLELLDELGAALAELIQRHDFTQASRIIRTRYPHCLAVFLVLQGVFHYDQGSYWPSVHERLFATGTRAGPLEAEWGQFFLEFLAQQGLANFATLERSLRYVTPILLHGGIPQYCLNDYFQLIFVRFDDLLHEARVPLDAATLETLAAVAAHSATDRPVARLIRYGGDYARDLLARTLALAQLTNDRQQLPDPIEVGLPQRVLDQYAVWHATRRQRSQERDPAWRPRRPELWFDPWGEGLSVELPAQQLPHGERPQSAWEICYQQRVVRYPVGARFTASRWETSPERVTLPPEPMGYTVRFTDGRELKHEWSFPGFDPHHPLLAFEPESGTLLRTPAGLPARELWLLCAAEAPLTVVGGRQMAALPPLSGVWQGFRMEHWDLRQARSLSVGTQRVAILPGEQTQRPYLTGLSPLDLGEAHPDLPLSVGGLPHLSIPRTSRRTLKQELAGWRVSIMAAGQAWFTAVPLDEAPVQPFVGVNPEQIVIDLGALVQARGFNFGLLEISVRGPLGRDNRFKLGLVPELAVEGHMNLAPSSKRGLSAERRSTLRTSTELDIACSDPSVRIIAEAPGVFTLISSEGRTMLPLILQRMDMDQLIRLPLNLPTPQLTWTLNDGAHIWQQGSLTCPLAWIEQTDDPRLMLQLTPAMDIADLPRPQLWLHDETGHALQTLAAQGNASHGWSFRLRDALDTLRASRSAHLTASVVLEAATPMPWAPTGRVVCPALQLSQALDLGKIEATVTTDAKEWHVHVCWQRGRPLRNRVMRLWPLWQPWEAPLTQRIPDTAEHNYAWSIDRDDVPPGRYRLQLAIETGWSMSTPIRPGPEADATLDLMLGSGVPTPTSARSALSALLAGAEGPDLRAVQGILTHEELPEGSDLIQTLAILSEPEATYAALRTGTWPGRLILREVTRQRQGLLPLGYLACHETLNEPSRERVAALIVAWQPSLVHLLQALEQSGSITLDALQQQTDSHEDDWQLVEQLQQLGVQIIDERLMYAEADQVHDPNWLTVLPHGLLQDSVSLYLHEIGQFKLLTYAEEQALAHRIIAGLEAEEQMRDWGTDLRTRIELQRTIELAHEARNCLALSNLRLVVSIARRYQNRGLEILDLIQEGNLGLLRAIDKFDPQRGYKFSTYATWWVKQAISRALADQSRVIRLPVHLSETLARINRAHRQLTQSLGREATDDELANFLNLSKEKLRHLRYTTQPPVSLATPVGEEDGSTLADLIPDGKAFEIDDAATQKMLRDELIKAFEHITERERDVLELRYGFNDGRERTLEEVGKVFDVTRERIRQIEVKALRKLRHPHAGKALRSYLD